MLSKQQRAYAIKEANNEARYEELYEKAVRRYLDKTDWNISDWLDKKEYKEFKKLQDN